VRHRESGAAAEFRTLSAWIVAASTRPWPEREVRTRRSAEEPFFTARCGSPSRAAPQRRVMRDASSPLGLAMARSTKNSRASPVTPRDESGSSWARPSSAWIFRAHGVGSSRPRLSNAAASTRTAMSPSRSASFRLSRAPRQLQLGAARAVPRELHAAVARGGLFVNDRTHHLAVERVLRGRALLRASGPRRRRGGPARTPGPWPPPGFAGGGALAAPGRGRASRA